MSHIPPKAVADAAARGLKLRAGMPASRRCCTSVGLARARQLSSRSPVSDDTVRRMWAYFRRHEVDALAPGWGVDSKGWQAWLLWGGDAGYKWVSRLLDKKENPQRLVDWQRGKPYFVGGVKFAKDGHGVTPNLSEWDYFSFATTIRPGTFLLLAKQLPDLGFDERSERMRGAIGRGEAFGPIELKFSKGVVIGHEGRHRVYEIEQADPYVLIPIVVTIAGVRARDLTEAMIRDLNAESVSEDGMFVKGPIFGPEAIYFDREGNEVRVDLTRQPNPARRSSDLPAAFWRWFGGSRIVLPDGSPRIMYHGTVAEFDEFRPFYRKGEQLGFGIHFASNREFAEWYADPEENARKKKGKPTVIEAYLRVERPLDAGAIVEEGSPEFALAKKLDPRGRTFENVRGPEYPRVRFMQGAIDATNGKRAEKLIREAGYDGVLYKAQMLEPTGTGHYRMRGEDESCVVFDPTQIKSVDNVGTYSLEDPRFRNPRRSVR